MRIVSASRKRLFKITAILAGILMLFAAAILVVGLVYGDKAKEIIVNEINSHLLVPVEVGQVDFTIFRSFPDASVVFRNVAMKPSAELSAAPCLLHAGSVTLKFSLFSLISGDYKIKSLVINRASITLWVGPDGKDNFHIWKQSTKSGSSGVSFDMQHVNIRNTEIYYRNLVKKTDLALLFPDFRLKGKMAETRHNLQASGEIAINRLIINDADYTPASKLGIDSEIAVDEKLKRCEIGFTQIHFAGIKTEISGYFGFGNDENPLQLSLKTSKADISGVMDALPSVLVSNYTAYEPGGRLTMTAGISGNWGKTSVPAIKAEFNIDKGSFAHQESGARIKNIGITGVFISGNGKIAESLNLSEFSGETKNGRFSGRIKVTDFANPMLDLLLKADLDLEEISGFIGNGEAGNMSGQFVADINYKGAYTAGEKMAVSANGLVRLANAGYEKSKSNIAVKGINGQFELKNGRVYVDGLQAVIGSSDLKLRGYFDNLPGYLFYKDQPLFFDVKFTSDKFILEDIMALSGSDSDSAGQQSVFPKGLSFKADFNIGKFSYKKFTASLATGSLSLDDNVLRANNLVFNALDGKVTATGLINGRYDDHAQIVCNAKLNNVDISRLFYEFEDFGQSSLQSKHIRGRGDATVQYASTLNKRYETDANSVTAVADVEIRNGELSDFEPLQELSRFLDADELRNVKFSTIRNRIEIAQKTVIIPEMEVQSSVLKLKGYGSHTFGNEIDYHFSVLTSELRKNKQRKAPPPPTAIEDDGLGQTRLFLYMTGTVDHPIINYDRRAVIKKIADDFKQEKRELRDVIRQEFSRNKPKPEEKEAKSSVKFEIEWDEDK